MTHDSMIEVIAAHRDGKEIEARLRNYEVYWNPCQGSGTFFNFRLYEYRIKPAQPKPREFVLAWNSQGIIQATELPGDWTGEVADHALRVREILPEN